MYILSFWREALLILAVLYVIYLRSKLVSTLATQAITPNKGCAVEQTLLARLFEILHSQDPLDQKFARMRAVEHAAEVLHGFKASDVEEVEAMPMG